MKELRNNIHNAIAFLSRMASPVTHEGNKLADAVLWFPLAGLLLGLSASLPCLLFPLSSFVGGWLYALLLAWLTRGLHWDGLADLADACGSNAQGERFWAILKDSRIGAFGVMGIALGFAGQIMAAAACLDSDKLLPLIIAPAIARSMVILFAERSLPHPASSLAALIQPGARSRASRGMLLFVLVSSAFALGLFAWLVSMLLLAFCLKTLLNIAKIHGGSNGDFYGTVVIVSEITVLLSATLSLPS